MKNNLPICEMFTSIQGEGSRAGYPAIFIRVSGCNLRCVFNNTICDTAYSSFVPEKSSVTFDEAVEYCTCQNPNIEDIIITGGEPMLYKDQVISFIREVSKYKNKYGKPTVFTIETNGTLPVISDADVPESILLISCSPKLSTAFKVKPGKDIKIPGGDKIKFTEEQIQQYDSRRINLDVLVQTIAEHITNPVQFKFVYTNEDTELEIKTLLDFIKSKCKDTGITPEYDVYLMPEGLNEKTLQLTRKATVDACIRNGWKYTDRLQIIIWGNQRGV